MAESRSQRKIAPHDEKMLRLGLNWEPDSGDNDEEVQIHGKQNDHRSRSSERRDRSRSHSRHRTKSADLKRELHSVDKGEQHFPSLQDRSDHNTLDLRNVEGEQDLKQINKVMSSKIEVLEKQLEEANSMATGIYKAYERQTDAMENERNNYQAQFEDIVTRTFDEKEALYQKLEQLERKLENQDRHWRTELQKQVSINHEQQKHLKQAVIDEKEKNRLIKDTDLPTLAKSDGQLDNKYVVDCMSSMLKTVNGLTQHVNEMKEENARLSSKLREFETKLGSPIHHTGRAEYLSPARHEVILGSKHPTPLARDDPRYYEDALGAATELTSIKPTHLAPPIASSSSYPHRGISVNTFPGASHPTTEARHEYIPPPPTPAHLFEYDDYEDTRPRHRSRDRKHRHHHHDKGPSVKIYDGMPRKFDGDKNNDPVAHLDSYDDYCMVQEITTGEERLKRFGLTLEGSARRWFSSIKPKSWREFALTFTRQYTGTKTYSIANEKFKHLKWNEGQESLETYRQNLTTLAQSVNRYYEVDEETGRQTSEISREFKSQFLMGLPHEYRLAMADLSEDNDFGTLMKRAEKFQGLKGENNPIKSSAMKVQVQPVTSPDNSGTDSDSMANLFRHVLDAISQVHKDYRKPYSTRRYSRSSSSDSRYGKDRYSNDRKYDRSRSRQRYDRRPYRSSERKRSSSRNRHDYRSRSRNRHDHRSNSRSRHDNSRDYRHRSRSRSQDRNSNSNRSNSSSRDRKSVV